MDHFHEIGDHPMIPNINTRPKSAFCSWLTQHQTQLNLTITDITSITIEPPSYIIAVRMINLATKVYIN